MDYDTVSIVSKVFKVFKVFLFGKVPFELNPVYASSGKSKSEGMSGDPA